MGEVIIRKLDEKYVGYLSDESSETGAAESISFPETESEAIELLHMLNEMHVSDITVQGSRTGLKGRAVPHGGHIINCSRMKGVIDSGMISQDEGHIVVQPGTTLQDLHEEIRKRFGKEGLFWPPAPSEESATVGGIVASKAFGINYSGYGKTTDYVSQIKTLSGNGIVQSLRTSEDIEKYLNDENSFKLITELSLKLIRRPEAIWGAAFFFDNAESAASFADLLQSFQCNEGSCVIAMEYIDHASIVIAEEFRSEITEMQKVPQIPDGTESIVYIEVAGREEENEETIMRIVEIAAEYGADPDTAWALFSESEAETMRKFRHSITEAATMVMARAHSNDPAVYLKSTDITASGKRFSECLGIVRDGIKSSKVSASVCAGIGCNMFRLCIMPESIEQMDSVHELIKKMIGEGMEVA